MLDDRAAESFVDESAPDSRPRPRVSGIAPALRKTCRGSIVGRSRKLVEALDLIDRVAKSSCTVLFTGESGTGKEVAVGALHDGSPREKAPLVTVNCGAIPEQLLETELFGHAKGAFTGAHAARQGRVAAAEGGTLFLDEIGDLPLALQVKLLRLLQEREYSKVGDTRTIPCDVRVVAATNRDLDAEVAAGRFREDLFYRLNVIHIRMPALRERPEDLAALATYFFEASAERAGRTDLLGISQDAMAILEAYTWPGNVRQLEHAIERAVLLAPGPFVVASDLPSRVLLSPAPVLATALPDAGIDLRAAVEQYENHIILQALERTGGNKKQAARLLGLNRTTLVEMLKRKNLCA